MARRKKAPEKSKAKKKATKPPEPAQGVEDPIEEPPTVAEAEAGQAGPVTEAGAVPEGMIRCPYCAKDLPREDGLAEYRCSNCLETFYDEAEEPDPEAEPDSTGDDETEKAEGVAAWEAGQRHLPKTPDAATYEHLRLLRIEEQGAMCTRFLTAWEDKKAEAAAAKKEYDEAVTVLLDMSRRKSPNEPLLKDVDDEKAIGNGRQPAESDQSWRSVPLSDLAITPGVLKSLAKADIETVGALADYTERGGRLSGPNGIKGIGPGKEEQIQDALMAFWKERDDHKAQGEPAKHPLADVHVADHGRPAEPVEPDDEPPAEPAKGQSGPRPIVRVVCPACNVEQNAYADAQEWECEECDAKFIVADNRAMKPAPVE